MSGLAEQCYRPGCEASVTGASNYCTIECEALATGTCPECGRAPGPEERHGYEVSDGGMGAMLVCIDADGHELGPIPKPCDCHGVIACPEPPDPPF